MHMSTEPASMPRPPLLAWNASAWFGAQLGGTAWMLVAAMILSPVDSVSAGVTGGLFVGANLLGLVLRSRRATLTPYVAYQVLVLVLGLCAAAMLLFVDVRGHLGALWWTGVPALDDAVRVAPRWTYAVLLVYPFLAMLLHVRLRALARAEEWS